MKIITLRPMGVLLSPPVRGMKIKNEPSAAVPRGPQILFQNNPMLLKTKKRSCGPGERVSFDGADKH